MSFALFKRARSVKEGERVTFPGEAAAMLSSDKQADPSTGHLALLAHALEIAFDTTPRSATEAILEQRRAISLDPVLTDSNGERLPTARIANLAPIDEALSTGTREGRVATLLDRVLAKITSEMSLEEDCNYLRVYLALPAPETPLRIDFAQQLFAQLWQSHNWAARGYSLHLVGAAGGGLRTSIALYCDSANSTPQGEPALFVAADSWIDPTLIEVLDARGELLSVARKRGVIPGEGAAALLLSGAQSTTAKRITAPVMISSPVIIEQASSSRARGRENASSLSACATAAIQRAGLKPEEIAAVACDSDTRPGRVEEVCAMMRDVVPHLHAVDDRIAVASALGDLGVASDLVSLGLASAFSESQGRAVLCVGVAHETERLAWVVAPQPESSAV